MKIWIDNQLYSIGNILDEYILVKNNVPKQIGFYAIKVIDFINLKKAVKINPEDAFINVHSLKLHEEKKEVTVGIPIGKRKLSDLLIINFNSCENQF